MAPLAYITALHQALRDEMARDERVCVLGEDVRLGLTGITQGLAQAYGPERVVDMPLSEQGFTSLATGAAMAGQRPVVEFQIPSLLYLVFEQIANQAHKFSLMTGGQVSVPVTYLVPGSGSRSGMAGQHSDHPYSLFAHVGSRPWCRRRRRTPTGCWCPRCATPDPVAVFAPTMLMGTAEEVTGELGPVPLGSARVHREGTDVTVVAVGHLVPTALQVAAELAGEVSIEVVDPRTVYPVDWATLGESVAKTGRLVVMDDSNRMCGLGGEILATAAEEYALVAPPKRVSRPDGAVIPYALALDHALLPSAAQLTEAVRAVLK
ncbi:alpha-ketoacid dehydrogenase subunit beta [Streptosporangium brasiliense]|uniref:Pyruvate dehydrogenase E1 component beta subunit n=1 Tax=Streptosporangium brasiliense TaxID=47480 RepID=A0ABT9R356_9ACTN|nr:transketolase C-terminal domain-containing protein [Streptosporangium brasiliense]MDP9863657.1 pyruvate dehydrogenase E1 component beta subunit [Streptosporangium brasiliense]